MSELSDEVREAAGELVSPEYMINLADRILALEQELVTLDPDIPVLDKMVTDLKQELAETNRKLTHCKHARKTELASWKPEAERLRKAIQEYLDCQTTNQWVVHFKKALLSR